MEYIQSNQFFVSYASKDRRLVLSFVELLEQHFGCAKGAECKIWRDNLIEIGEDWDARIQDAIKASQGGILIVSPAMLASDYIRKNELQQLLAKDIVIPIMLRDIDFQHHNLQGVEKRQIKAFEATPGKRKSFAKCTTQQREDFVLQVFQAIMKKIKEVAA